MKKQVLIPVLTGVAVFGLLGLVIWAADEAKPGDLLYSLDRSTETVKLSFLKSTNSLAFGKFNLVLADERFNEITSLKNVPASSARSFKVAAQSTPEQILQEQIGALLTDIEQNLIAAQDTLFTLQAEEQQELSLQIAEKTTEYGNELLVIARDMPAATTEQLQAMVARLEKLDESAVELLVEAREEAAENEDEDSEEDDDISETLQTKMETKLLKLREALRIYAARMETNKTQLQAADITKATALIAEITGQLSTAEIQLGQQAYKTVDDILDVAADNIDELKDLVKVEGDEDAGQDSDDEDEQETEIEDEDEQEDEEEDEQEDEEDDKPTPSTTRSVSSTPKPTEKPEDEEEEEEVEEEEEEEEVEGAQTQPASYLDILRNQLRF